MGDSEEDRIFLQNIYHNAVVYHVKEKKFPKARFYLGKSNENDLRKYVDEQEGAYEYDNGSLNKARELFKQAGNMQMVKATYAKEYNQLQSRVSGIKDLSTMRAHRYDYEKMLDLARKMEDSTLIENLNELLKQL